MEECQMNFCSYCGNKLSEGDAFCVKCGKQVTSAPIFTEAKSDANPIREIYQQQAMPHSQKATSTSNISTAFNAISIIGLIIICITVFSPWVRVMNHWEYKLFDMYDIVRTAASIYENAGFIQFMCTVFIVIFFGSMVLIIGSLFTSNPRKKKLLSVLGFILSSILTITFIIIIASVGRTTSFTAFPIMCLSFSFILATISSYIPVSSIKSKRYFSLSITFFITGILLLLIGLVINILTIVLFIPLLILSIVFYKKALKGPCAPTSS
jgi:hypothetical protein